MNHKTVYSDSHQDIPFEIHERDTDRGKCWTYYIFLHEAKFPRFSELWLEPKLKTEYTQPYITYDYMSTWAADINGWNGSVTFYHKHGELPGYRCVEYGCDFLHIWDMDREYTLDDILLNVTTTINNLIPFLQ